MTSGPARCAWLLVALVLFACDEGAASRDGLPTTSSGVEGDTPVAAPAETAERQKASSVVAIRRVMGEPRGLERVASLADLLVEIGPEASDSFPTLLSDPTLDLQTAEYALLVRYWARHQPERAGEWSLTQSPWPIRPAAVESAVEQWARVDPESAARAVDQASRGVPGPAGAEAERALVHGWFESGRPGVERHIRHLGVGFGRQRALAEYVRCMLRRDGPDAVIGFADSVPDDDGPYRLDVLRQTAFELARQHPEMAAAWCDRVCSDEVGARPIVAERWAERSGRAAMEWATMTPSARSRNPTVLGAFRGWYRSDPEGLAGFIRDTAERDEVTPPWLELLLETYAGVIALIDVEEALDIANRIADDERRSRTLVTVARLWRRQEPAAAEDWLEASELSEAARAEARTEVRAEGPPRRRAPATARPRAGSNVDRAGP